jgi:alpha-galactosidase
MNAEGRTAPAGQHWQSEALICLEGPDREALLATLAQHIEAEHGSWWGGGARPSGWCSWYHYYADVSAADIRENLAVRAERFPALRYVQIDDGYQARMGTGSPSAKFEQGVAPWQGRSAPPAASPRSGSPPLSPSPARRCFSSTLTGS